MTVEAGSYYLICFDFPELDEPWFAGWVGNETLGLAPTMKTAARFDSFNTAKRHLKGYGPVVGECGAVVKIARVTE